MLFVYGDRVGAEMGGVGIRAVELARALAEATGARVSIAAAETDGADLGIPVSTYDPHAPRALDAPLADADAVVAQPPWPLLMRRLSRSRARLIFDLYDPEVFGTLAHFRARRAPLRSLMSAYAGDRVLASLARGNHVMCASERQRDLWIGAMLGAGLIAPRAYDEDPTLRSRVDVVPYGVPSKPPPGGSPRDGPRERLSLGDGDLVLWNGGIWSWLDAPTAIEAIGLLRRRRPGARLLFMGASRAGPAASATREAEARARELGLLGTGVIFNDTWVPYEERAAWLLDADCAISTHVDDLEARFSSRTRLLDCFWAGLPVACTSGDELAAEVVREDLGALAAPRDATGLADALERVLTRGRGSYAAPLAAAATRHSWSRAIEPLVRWLERPPPAPLGRGLGRRPSQLVRTGAYIGPAAALGALRLPAPRLPAQGRARKLSAAPARRA